MKYLDFTLLFLLIIIMLCQCQNYFKKEQFNNYKATESESYDHHRIVTLYNGIVGSTDTSTISNRSGTMGNGPYDSWISPLKTHLDNFYTNTGSYATGSSSDENIALCESNMTPMKTRIRDLGSYGGIASAEGIDYIPYVNRDKQDNMFYYNVYGKDGSGVNKAYDRNFNEWDVDGSSTLVTNKACERGLTNIAQVETKATP